MKRLLSKLVPKDYNIKSLDDVKRIHGYGEENLMFFKLGLWKEPLAVHRNWRFSTGTPYEDYKNYYVLLEEEVYDPH